MRFIENAPIWIKASATSFVLLLCLLATGGNAYITIERSANGLTQLSNTDLPRERAIAEFIPTFITCHVKIFRFANWTSNGVKADLLKSLRSEIAADLTSIDKELRSLVQTLNPLQEKDDLLRALISGWADYQRRAETAVEIASIAPPAATMALEALHDDFQMVASTLDGLSASLRDRSSSFARDLTSLASTNRAILIIVGVLGVVISALAALFVGRSMVLPIQAITQSMRDISSRTSTRGVANPERKDEIGQMVRAISIFRQTLEAQTLRFDTALSNMSQGLAMFDHEERLVLCNERYAKLYHLTPEMTAAGTTSQQITEFRIANGTYYVGISAEDHRRQSKRVSGVRIRQLHDGRVVSLLRQPMPDGGWVTTHEDVTEQQVSAARVAHMAKHDALTDLPNRVLLRERLEGALEGNRKSDNGLALHMVDLDRFKEVNDTLGHPVGDALLRAVADRLRGCVREGDTVARLGGDEFAILESITEPMQDARALAKRVIAELTKPFEIAGNEVSIGASIGIALAGLDGTDPDQLLKNVDLALYRAKADGRGVYRFFAPEMDQHMQARRQLETDLKSALVNGQFELHYQPLVNLQRDEICGFEALLRWNHPKLGKVPPSEFIPLAEETGLIVPIGDWVLRQACTEAATWSSHLKIAVNLSPVQFRARNLVETIVHTLAATGMAPHRLELELTESMLLQDEQSAFAMMTRLQGLGVRIALDDFGIGYSSLSNLRKFPFDKIKIDRSFVKDLSLANVDALAVVRAVAKLGVSLGMATTAEGVETKEQLDYVRAEGCTEIQGYYICPPSPAHEIARLLQAKAPCSSAAA